MHGSTDRAIAEWPRRATTLLLAGILGCGRIGFSTADRSGAADATPAGDGDGDGGGSNTAALIQTTSPGYVSATSMTVPLSHAQGTLLVAAVYWNTAASTITMSDTVGLTWSSTPTRSIASGCGAPTGGAAVQIWYAVATSASSNMITATQSATTNPLALFVAEYAGIAIATPFHASTGSVAAAASNNMSSGDLPTTTDTLIFGLFHNSLGTGTMTPGTGWSSRGIDTMSYAMFVDNVPGAGAGTYQVTGRLPVGRSDACTVATAVAFDLD